MTDTGINFQNINGYFGLGWTGFGSPFSGVGDLRFGVAHAIAFDLNQISNTRAELDLLDMGDVNLSYGGNTLQLLKMNFPPSVYYSSIGFNIRPDLVSIPFLPHTAYEFETTGSDKIPPIKIALTTPAQLLEITSPASLETFNPSNDLTVTWTAATSNNGRTLLTVTPMPIIDISNPPNPDGIFFKPFQTVINGNITSYTIPADTLGRLANFPDGIELQGVSLHVSQFITEFKDVADKKFAAVLHNGDVVFLNKAKN